MISFDADIYSNVLKYLVWHGTKVPEIVLDKRTSAYNKGRVFIHGASEITANAYKKQFQTDLAGFLRARSVEMKRGGSMFLVCLGRTSMDPTDQCGAGLLFGTHFQDAWDDLVQEVIIIITQHFYSFFLFELWWAHYKE
ncbi:putative indole-3-acetate O-methyltransferase [Lupinus albus]|uniref:Putative indole-3-acetate O-methyltransferase n=1 Tax=Lupinus albus TaxID=3870 RepID=A0A6A4NYA9_LUPAL|nr:putative indole-3-acetate O-methyltransferase [Lupinus albus]